MDPNYGTPPTIRGSINGLEGKKIWYSPKPLSESNEWTSISPKYLACQPKGNTNLELKRMILPHAKVIGDVNLASQMLQKDLVEHHAKKERGEALSNAKQFGEPKLLPQKLQNKLFKRHAKEARREIFNVSSSLTNFA